MFKFLREPTVSEKMKMLLRESAMNAVTQRMLAEDNEVLQAHHRAQADMYAKRVLWLGEELDALTQGQPPMPHPKPAINHDLHVVSHVSGELSPPRRP
jgi:hypothetical protein